MMEKDNYVVKVGQKAWEEVIAILKL